MTLRCLRLVDRERGKSPSGWSSRRCALRRPGARAALSPDRGADGVKRPRTPRLACGERVRVSAGGHLSPRSGRRKNQILRHFLYETQKSVYNFPDGPIEPWPRPPDDEEPGRRRTLDRRGAAGEKFYLNRP